MVRWDGLQGPRGENAGAWTAGLSGGVDDELWRLSWAQIPEKDWAVKNRKEKTEKRGWAGRGEVGGLNYRRTKEIVESLTLENSSSNPTTPLPRWNQGV